MSIGEQAEIAAPRITARVAQHERGARVHEYARFAAGQIELVRDVVTRRRGIAVANTEQQLLGGERQGRAERCA